MKKSWMFRTQILAVVLGLVFCANAVAQEPGAAGGGDEQAEAQAMKAELQAIKAELKALRGELRQVLTEVKAIKGTQARPAKPPKQQRPKDTTVYDIELTGAPIRGPQEAKVTIVEFVDFECPYSARELPVIKQVMEAYPNDVRWAFKHFPLGFHKKAKPAHAAAALAFKQKGNEGFWQMHDLILGDRKKMEIADLRGYAETVGLELAEFDAVMADEAQINALLQKDIDGAKKYKVRGTPSVFVNGLKLSPRTFENYKARIDDILKGGGKAAGGAKVVKPTKVEVKRGG